MKKLYRSRTDRKVSGVCGGIGDYFGVDSTFVRILFVILLFAWGSGVLAYFVLAWVIPIEPYRYNNEYFNPFSRDEYTSQSKTRHRKDVTPD